MGTVDALYWMISGGVIPGWQLSQNGLGNGGQLGHRGRRVRALLKENFDYAKAVIGGRFDVLDIVDRGRERSLFAVDNSLRRFGRPAVRCNSRSH